MSLRNNMAAFFRSFAEQNGLSIAKLQAKADVSRNTIYAYSRGEGNPTFDTLEYIAGNLQVEPTDITMGVYVPEGREFSVLLLTTVSGVSRLPREDRQKFVQLFLAEMAKLWNKE